MKTENQVSHTPGEWKVAALPIRNSLGVPQSKIYRSNAIGQEKIIANVFGETLEECQSRARLIAAAPELLKVMEKINEYYWPHFSEKDTQLVRETINKAKNL